MAKYKVGFRYNDGQQEYEITKILNFSSVPWYECLHIGSSPEMYYTVSEETVDRLTAPRFVPNETTTAAIQEAREMSLPLGRKFDADKTQYRLVPPLALKEVADVLTFGARKYEENNWKHVDNLQKRYLDAAMRHIEDYRMGNSKDPESNLHHLAHAICCLMFKIEIYKEGENK